MRRVTAAWAELVLDWLDAGNVDAPEIRAAIRSRSRDETFPAHVFRELLEQGVALRRGVVAPGLAIGALVQPRHMGVLGYLVLATQNLGDALRAYQRYERLLFGVEQSEVVVAGGEIEVRWHRVDDRLGPLGEAVGLAALVTFLRNQLEAPPPPVSIGFANESPKTEEERAAYVQFFGCPVHYNDGRTSVRFPESYLTIAMPRRDPELREILDAQAEALLSAVPDAGAELRDLQRVILKLLPDAGATLPRAAKELHLSVRTLQRRLDDRGVTWQQLLDSTREQLARRYLADRSLGLGEIALLLGFSEQSAFTRSYRRWTGETPSSVRRGR